MSNDVMKYMKSTIGLMSLHFKVLSTDVAHYVEQSLLYSSVT